MNATVGSLAKDIFNVTPPRFGRSERRAEASDDALLNDTSPSSSVAAGALSREATTGTRARGRRRDRGLGRDTRYYMCYLLEHILNDDDLVYDMGGDDDGITCHCMMALVLIGC